MENKETLRQYFSYNRNIEGNQILDIFLELDYKLSVIHNNGYVVGSLNSDNIVYENGFNFSTDSFRQMYSEEAKRQNISDLAKLNMGTQVSVASGFSDFTVIDSKVLAENFETIAASLTPATSGDEYLRAVIVKGSNDMYYNDYLLALRKENEAGGAGKSQTMVKVKSTEAGRAMSMDDSDAAFINLAFYPIMIGLILLIISVIATLI